MNSLIVVPMATVRMPEFLMQFVAARSNLLIIGGPGVADDPRAAFYLAALHSIRGARTVYVESPLGMERCFAACRNSISGDPLLLWTDDDIWISDLPAWEQRQRQGIGCRFTFSGSLSCQDCYLHFGFIKVRASHLYSALDEGSIDFSVPFYDRPLLEQLELPHLQDIAIHLTHPMLGSAFQAAYDAEGGNILWATL